MFSCHRDFLLDQTAEAFDEVDLPHTFVAAGREYNPYSNVVIASIDTLKRRMERIKAPDVLIVDECVHAAAAGWAKVIEYYQAQGCYTIGLTACPQRLSGQGLGKWFKDMVLGPSTGDLIDAGYLSRYKAFAPSSPDLGGVHSRGGDYVVSEITKKMDKPSITGNAVDEYKKIAPGKQALMFCCSIEHSINVMYAFQAAGFSAAHIGADTDQLTRFQMLRDYRLGKLQVLTSVDIFNEGFNVPAASYAGLLRPTKSLSIFLQQCGRVLRVEEGKEFAFISDHANNIAHHGLPDDDRVWTLASKEKKDRDEERAIPTRQCPKCFFVFRPAANCPNCGFELPIQYREVEEKAGQLTEIDRDRARENKMRLQGMAKTFEELIEVGKKLGYDNPTGWARHIYNSRQSKKQTDRQGKIL